MQKLLAVSALLCVSKVFAAAKHSLIEENVSLESQVNVDIRAAQEQVLNSVSSGVVVTDGQIDEAVKQAFAPIFTKCEAITEPKKQRICLLNSAAGKKVTSAGAKAQAKKQAKKAAGKKAAKKAEKKAAAKEAAKIVKPAAAPKAAAVKKDKVAADAAKAKEHLAKAAALSKQAADEKKKAAAFEAKLKKDIKKEAAKAQKALKAVKKADKKAKNVTKKAAKDAKKKAAFIEFDAEMEDADMLHAETLDSIRDNILAFLEVAEEVSPATGAQAHLETIDISLNDLQDLEIPEVNTAEIDQVLRAVEEVTATAPESFLETEAQTEEVVEDQTEAKAEIKVAVTDAERAHEGEASLIAAAEAEMNRDLANFGEAQAKKDVIDLSDLEDIESLSI